MRSKRRILIILAISIGLHAVLLAVHLRRDASLPAGQGHLVGLVSRGVNNFAPVPPVVRTMRTVEPVVVVKKQAPARPERIRKHLDSIQESIESLSVLEKKLAAVTKQVEAVADPIQVVETSVEPVGEVSDAQLPAVDDEDTLSRAANLLTTGNVSPAAGPLIAPISRAIPRYADNPRPAYPEVARRKGWVGEVRLFVLVDKSGTVDRLSVRRSSGYSVLDRAAKQAVRLWRFVPATEGGRRVASEFVVPIDFRLPVSDRLRSAQASPPKK